jgi:hypothetical protein
LIGKRGMIKWENELLNNFDSATHLNTILSYHIYVWPFWVRKYDRELSYLCLAVLSTIYVRVHIHHINYFIIQLNYLNEYFSIELD